MHDLFCKQQLPSDMIRLLSLNRKNRSIMYGFCPLASGSKGNCLYIGTKRTKILIDLGISMRRLQQRLAEIEVQLEEIDAIIVSHEHSDHMRGIERMTACYDLPVLANGETAKMLVTMLKKRPRFKVFSTGEPFEFGDIAVYPFSVQHDTVDPVAFIFQLGNVKIGVCTDLGFVTSLVKLHLQNCDYLYVEANHEPSLVYGCSRPNFYKQRVLGRQGHLSNDNCADLIEAVYHDQLKHVYLAHLSEECNRPEVALERIYQRLKGKNVTVSIAHQHQISTPIRLES